MSVYKSYTHVEGLHKDACEGLLNNSAVYVSAKLDGTNACVWVDEDGKIKCGSRKREINVDDDNAGFAKWAYSDDNIAKKIRKFVIDHPELIIYGEWMGSSKFVGFIKDYNKEALNHFYIFDVFDIGNMEYMCESEWRNLLSAYDLEDSFVELLAVLSYPSIEDIENIAKKNNFLLNNANHPGEGVVCKAFGWKNKYGHTTYGKFVLEEYKQNKAESKKVKVDKGEVEQNIVDLFLTNYEMSKTKEKVVLACGAESFDNTNPKMVGRYLSTCYHDAILEECPNWAKKFKNATVNFGRLQYLANAKSRAYIGL